jgi:sulfopropanediol 3-dehydrogenase
VVINDYEVMSKSCATNADDYRRSEIAETVAHIIDAIRRRGDDAVREYAMRLDGWVPDDFRLSRSYIEECIDQLPTSTLEDMRLAQDRIARFADAQRASLSDVEIETAPGVRVGHRHIPYASVGAFVPGRRRLPVAAAQMSALAARAAGVERIVAYVPPREGRPAAADVAAMHLAGADEIYAVGNVHGLAALALGTESIPRVDVIVASGNAYFLEAQRQLLGKVGIEVLGGPAEILIVADESADPQIVAADLLAQAEHGPDARVVLVTTSSELAARIPDEVERQLAELPMSGVARTAWHRHGAIHLVATAEEACAIADRHAFEHVEILTLDPRWYLERLHNYGALFMGAGTTAAFGDAAIGTNQTLPTGRAARFSGALWVGTYMKTVTYQECADPRRSRNVGEACARQSRLLGLEAHARACDLHMARADDVAGVRALP